MWSISTTEDVTVTKVDSLVRRAEELAQDKSEIIKALDIYQQAFAIVEHLPENHEARALLYGRYMKFLDEIGNYDEALEYGLKLISICENPDYTGKQFYVYHDAGKIYLELGQNGKAIEIEKRGLSRIVSLGDSLNLGLGFTQANNEIGLTYFRIGQYEKAVEHYRIARQEKSLNDHYLFVIDENIAEALIRDGKYYEARLLLDQMRNAKGRYEHERRNINYLMLELEISLLSDDLKRAEQFLELSKKALLSSNEKKDPEMWARLFESENRLYILRKDQRKIIDFHRYLERFTDSLDVIQKRSIVSSRNSFYKKQLENKDLKLRNSQLILEKNRSVLYQRELENKNRNLWVFGIGFVVISFLLTIIIVVRRRVENERKKREQERGQKERAKEELAKTESERRELESILGHKEKDIATLSSYLLGSTEQISVLREMLRRINTISDPVEKENLLLEFLSNARTKIQIFEKHGKMLDIESVNRDFFDRLLNKHPKLTRSEKTLCGLIRTGLTNSEIAVRQNTTVNTIKTAKNRLKRKLQLTFDDDLHSYLENF